MWESGMREYRRNFSDEQKKKHLETCAKNRAKRKSKRNK